MKVDSGVLKRRMNLEKEYNLLSEPWIKVVDQNNMMQEVSLCDFFHNAHKYKQLAGETVTQDVAVYRILQAIVSTVFYRYDLEGKKANIVDAFDPEEEVLNRFKMYWEKGSFDGKVFTEYLNEFQERFYLFHPETPFWQVNEIPREATSYKIINLYGNMKESNNVATKHHFHVKDGMAAENISYAEAARWLIYTNAYSVNVKTKVDGMNKATGVGRLGQLGFFMADESNLFKKLLINLCALDKDNRTWENPNPIWEQKPRKHPGVEISPPDNLPEMYTLQSRRILLKREGKKITGFSSIGGDYYNTVNDLSEPMTLLYRKEKEGTIHPKKHRKEIMVWREIPCVLTLTDDTTPGLIVWLKYLKNNGMLDKNKYITFKMIGLEYGDGMSYTNGEIYNQSLSLSKDLMENVGGSWSRLIIDEVGKCEEVTGKAFYVFVKNLCEKIYGGDPNQRKKLGVAMTEEYYYGVDRKFREWLSNIEPFCDIKEERLGEWESISSELAINTMKRCLRGVDAARAVMASEAVNAFYVVLHKIYPLDNHRKGG